MKEHQMKLKPSPFTLIKEGKKTIELRLYDEKRKLISIGDTITFTNTNDSKDIIKSSVIDLYLFDSFEELYNTLPLNECGYTDVKNASYLDMEKYYSKEEQSKYGVVGIKIAVHQ